MVHLPLDGLTKLNNSLVAQLQMFQGIQKIEADGNRSVLRKRQHGSRLFIYEENDEEEDLHGDTELETFYMNS